MSTSFPSVTLPTPNPALPPATSLSMPIPPPYIVPAPAMPPAPGDLTLAEQIAPAIAAALSATGVPDVVVSCKATVGGSTVVADEQAVRILAQVGREEQWRVQRRFALPDGVPRLMFTAAPTT